MEYEELRCFLSACEDIDRREVEMCKAQVKAAYDSVVAIAKMLGSK